MRIRLSSHERQADYRAIADFLGGLTGKEADEVLRAARATFVSPAGWFFKQPAQRRPILLAKLAGQNPDVIETLALIARDAGSGADDPGPVAHEPPERQVGAVSQPLEAAGAGRATAGGNPAGLDKTLPIFVVHGHAAAIRHEVVRVLERSTGREVTVLHEQPNAGRTILEKFEEHAAGAAYAVVLLTGDDEGGAASGTDRHPRGRQNVIFELGFFFGKLGRDRVAVLLEAGVEEPSDINGLVYITIDGAGAWKQTLARELASAEIDVDYSRIP